MKISGSWFSFGISCALGAAVFFLIIGPNALDPRNSAWLTGGFDPTQHYLGWVFYRYSPWTLPLGLNPNFGLDISSSIVYSDSIPLLAIFFKLFSPWLSEPFQYLGLWMLACFILQAYFGLRLLSLITPKLLLQVLGAAFFVISPIMLWRMGLHAALAGHFLILAALYLVLRPLDKQTQGHQVGAWVLLLICAALIQPYLLAMGLILWGVDLLSRSQAFARQQERANLSAVLPTLIKATWEIILVLVILAGVMWQAGYFVISSSTTAMVVGHYGIGRLNGLAIFDPNAWSYLLPNIADAPDQLDHFNFSAREFESFTYLGLGIFFCTGFALWGGYHQKISLSALIGRYRWLFLGALGMTLFALSNRLAIGPWSVYLPLPDTLLALASILRAGARLFWPVYYLLILLMLYTLIKSYAARWAILILGLGLAIQLTDTSSGWLVLRHQMMKAKVSLWGGPLKNSFWEAAAKKYQRVERIPTQDQWMIAFPTEWDIWANYAVLHGLGTNSVFLSRMDEKKFQDSRAKQLQQLQTGQYESDTLYILEDDKVMLALAHLRDEVDLLARIDNYTVLAPGWLSCTTCAIPSERLGWNNLRPQYKEPILFSKGGLGQYYLGKGAWGWPEEWGVWSTAAMGTLTLPMPRPANQAQNLIISTRAFVNAKHPQQALELWVNGKLEQNITLTQGSANLIVIPLSQSMKDQPSLQIEFKFNNPAKPSDLGLGNDERLLAIGLEKAVFQ